MNQHTTNAPTTLEDILASMTDFARAERDGFARAHRKADDLLVMTIQVLSRGYSPETVALIESIIDQYEEVGKWYD